MSLLSDLLNWFSRPMPGANNPDVSMPFQLPFQEWIDDTKVPGLAITVLHSGEKVFQKGYGWADIEGRKPVDPQKTIFRIASASKPIASMALAKMVMAGQIDLDKSFYNYVPYFTKKQSDFTIRQLATHTAGIRGYRGKEYALNKPYTIKDSLELFQEDPLLFSPGTGYLYNSFGWVLISLAMEEVSGESFSGYVQKEILNPLGMNNTLVEVPGEMPEGKAVPYTRFNSGFRPAVPVDNRYKLAGGGYLSTTEDLVKLGTAVLENSLVSPEVMKEFLTPQKINGYSTHYGLGWQVSVDKSGRPYIGHVGNGVGGYSNFFVYPDDEVVISLLINCTDPKVQPLLDDLVLPPVLNQLSQR
ncbi:serine hydrolase domain-containing protein [Muriicola soli]|uniref:Class A beta-lactamase-related serine hydrolase n=1 Tax=Muriicola soli TaxID=2507538 RepID=A0A411E6S0_9FLAO|nr:serine hydrolase domain-containing protein [Muriicola soli]QBA63389.1 class A beta-lactamase-related serine hydrolase [Muriicola soli]